MTLDKCVSVQVHGTGAPQPPHQFALEMLHVSGIGCVQRESYQMGGVRLQHPECFCNQNDFAFVCLSTLRSPSFVCLSTMLKTVQEANVGHKALNGPTFERYRADIHTCLDWGTARVRSGRPLLTRMQKRAPGNRARQPLDSLLCQCRVVVCHVDKEISRSVAQNT